MQGKVLPERSAGEEVYVGIDVCKGWLDIHLHPIGRTLRLANSRDGIRRFPRDLSGRPVALVVMEATGKYHRMAHRMLSAAGLAVAVVNPLRARLFAEATGRLAKTDRLDAELLAVLGESLRPGATPPQSHDLETLNELVRARRAASGERTAIVNRLAATQSAFLRAELKRRLKAMETHVRRLEAEILRRIAGEPALARRYEVLCSIPGIGMVAAITLLVELAELGACSGKAAAMLAGLAPIACDTGQKTGQRRIRGGRAGVRRALYMAALAAARHNPQFAAVYKRLKANGKPPKVALTAVMRKLLVLANTLLTENRRWQPTPPQTT